MPSTVDMTVLTTCDTTTVNQTKNSTEPGVVLLFPLESDSGTISQSPLLTFRNMLNISYLAITNGYYDGMMTERRSGEPLHSAASQ